MIATIKEAADRAASLGISVIPPAEDGSKRPGVGEWKSYQKQRASHEELGSWFGSRTGLGFVTGGVSSGLELFEFDDDAVYEKFRAAAAALGGSELVESIEAGYLEKTPGNGVHWFYYTDEIRGSTKLARRRKTPDEFTADDRQAIEAAKKLGKELHPTKTLIETKGEGGFVIVAPSFGRVHPSGKPYRKVRGDLETIATISGVERQWLWDLARSFDGCPTEVAPDPVETRAIKLTSGDWPDLLSPGDDFIERSTWGDILTGWTLAFRHGDTQYWRRPGKSFGHSATVNHNGTDRLHVFTSSSEFQPGTSYSRFSAFALLSHRGDFTAAARALYTAGFGTHKRWVREKHEWVLRVFQNPCPKGHRLAKPGDPPPDEQKPPATTPQTAGPVQGESAENEFESLSDEDLGLESAARIAPEPIRWEWQNRVARGKLNLLAGEGGDGKSQIAIAVTAAVTSGGKFPDGTGPVEPGSCIILAAEDGAKDTIVPRLIAAKAELSRVFIHTAKVTMKDKAGKTIIHPISFQDLSYWRVVLTRHKVRVLIADPVPAYLGRGVNDHRNNEVRAVLEPFVDLLDELGVALIAITHLNKSTDQKTPTHKILGSVAYANLARTVHCTYRDPDDAERRFFCMVKSNIIAPQQTLAFRINSVNFTHGVHEIVTSKVDFESAPVDWSPAAHMAGQKQSTTPPGRPAAKVMEHAEFLYDLLFGNGWMPLARIIEDAGIMGVIGEQKDDGKYPCVNNLYRAQERVPHLPPPKDGFQIVVQKMPFKGYGKETPHWKLEPLEDVPF